MRCIKCGQELMTGDDPISGICYRCRYTKDDQNIQVHFSGGNHGWICPRCGKVNAPWVSSCDCQGLVVSIACSSDNSQLIHRDNLIAKLDEYIKLLVAELDDCVPFAVVHHWSSSRVGEGEKMRKEISELREKIIVPDSTDHIPIGVSA